MRLGGISYNADTETGQGTYGLWLCAVHKAQLLAVVEKIPPFEKATGFDAIGMGDSLLFTLSSTTL